MTFARSISYRSIAGGLVWCILVTAGLYKLLDYENRPGDHFNPPTLFPANAFPISDPALPVLVMAVHPHCPCTRASMGELALIMSHCQGLVNAYVLFLKPESAKNKWEQTDLWRHAVRIPGVFAISDYEGSKAALFAATVSGQTALYGTGGQLLFHGGITASRGHSGDNAGRSAIEAILHSKTPAARQTLSFGCSLREKENSCECESTQSETAL